MPYIAEGTYGCGFFPHLKCTTGKQKKEAMGKIFSDPDSLTEEQEISEIVQKLDPTNEFTIPYYESCTTDLSQADKDDKINLCSHTNTLVNEGTTQTRQLLYRFGGVDLQNLVQHFASVRYRFIDDLIHLLVPIIKGIIILQQHEYIHCDIKPPNILYDDKKGKLFLIDFGLLTRFKELPVKTIVTQFTYPYYPPEFKIHYHLVYKRDKALTIVRTIARNFEAYGSTRFNDFLKHHCGITNTIEMSTLQVIAKAEKDLEQFKADFTTQFVKKVDIYSLGITFVELCFVLERSNVMRVRNRQLFDTFMKTIIPRMIDFDPYERADPQTILDAIKGLLRNHKIPTSPILKKSPVVKKIDTPNIPSPKSVSIPDDCMKLKRAQIVELLKAHSLPVSGGKKTLCERVRTITKEQCIKSLLKNHNMPQVVKKVDTPSIPSPKSVSVPEDCMKLKRAQIVELLKAHSLPISGTKTTLCQRLQKLTHKNAKHSKTGGK
jgi:serine/threonine protein kinase